MQNDLQADIQQAGKILSMLLPNRYLPIQHACSNGHYANIHSLRRAIEKRHKLATLLPYAISTFILIITILLSVHTHMIYQKSKDMAQVAEEYNQHRSMEETMIMQIDSLITIEIQQLIVAANESSSYIAFTKHPVYSSIWDSQALLRDSLAYTYKDDSDLKHKCITIWAQEFGSRFIHIDQQVKQSKPIF